MGRPKKNFDSVVEMYKSGLSLQDIGNIIGTTRQSVWGVLKRRGIRMRPQKRYGVENTFHRGGRVNGKREARYAMQAATDRGIIRRGMKCEQCGTEKFIEGHHDDYNKPLTVRWLCKVCHFDWHRKNKAIPLAKR